MSRTKCLWQLMLVEVWLSKQVLCQFAISKHTDQVQAKVVLQSVG